MKPSCQFSGGRQAEFKGSKLVDDKLIPLSVSLPQGNQKKRWSGNKLVNEESLKAEEGGGEYSLFVGDWEVGKWVNVSECKAVTTVTNS